jgi:hypothetical protein
MAQERVVRRDRALPDRLLPVRVRRELDVTHDEVDHGVDEVALVVHVVVQRHGFDPEVFCELPHTERVEPAVVGKRDGSAHHPVSRQRKLSLMTHLA